MKTTLLPLQKVKREKSCAYRVLQFISRYSVEIVTSVLVRYFRKKLWKLEFRGGQSFYNTMRIWALLSEMWKGRKSKQHDSSYLRDVLKVLHLYLAYTYRYMDWLGSVWEGCGTNIRSLDKSSCYFRPYRINVLQ